MRGTVHVSTDVDKGMDLARIARVMAMGKTVHERAAIAEQTGLPSRLVDIVKTPVSVGQTDGSTWGAELAAFQVVTSSFFESLRNTGAFFRMLDAMARVPLKSKIAAITAGASGYVQGQGSAQKISRLSLETEAINPFRASSIVIISQELAEMGAAADPLISANLRGATSVAVDEQFLIILDAGATTGASVGSTVSAVQQDLRAALQALDLGQSSRLFFIAHPDVVKALATMTIDGSFAFADVHPVSGGLLLKVPLIPCDACAVGSFYAVDATGIAGGTDTINIDRHREGIVQMDTAPDSPETASTVLLPLWQRNLIAIVASCWAGAKVVRGNSVHRITGVDGWGSGNSP